MAVPSTFLISTLLSLLLLLLLSSPSAANEGNILVTGNVLYTDDQLSVPNAVFVIQNDCNLVLYNKGRGFESNTNGLGTNCTLTLSEYGQLIIKNGNGTDIWFSASSGSKGQYAAILQPDGQVGIYGPSLWSAPHRSPWHGTGPADTDKIKSEPNVPNLLFSSEVLNEYSKLVSRDYAFQVTDGCSLEFTKGSASEWKTPFRGAGRHCFMRLNFFGQLALVDDNYRILWETKPVNKEGVYVLAVTITGETVIYGPRIWSTESIPN